MPSPTHQILVELFRRRPALLTDLLEAVAVPVPSLNLPPGARIVPTTATFTDLTHAEEALEVEHLRVFARCKRCLAIGEKAGHAAALRALLSDQLTERFGPLPEAARHEIQDASPEVLAHWGRRVLSAVSLDDVLASAT